MKCSPQDRREARLKDEIEKYRAENPKITEQFADLKRKLGAVSESEWEGIPEIGDRTIKNKARRFESFVPVPDTLLAAAAAEKQGSSLQPGTETSGYATTDLTAVGEGRETVRGRESLCHSSSCKFLVSRMHLLDIMIAHCAQQNSLL